MADYTSESLGGLILAGETQAEVRHFALGSEGGLILSGDSEYGVSSVIIESEGGLILSGDAGYGVSSVIIESEGGLLLSGSSFSKVNPEIASGGFVLSGITTQQIRFITETIGGITLGSSTEYGISSAHVIPQGGIVLGGTNTAALTSVHVIAEGNLIIAGNPNYGISSVHVESEGGLLVAGSSLPSVYFIIDETYTWNINGTIQKDQTFTWDIGKQVLNYYTIEGICARPPTCDINGVDLGDELCSFGGSRFSQTIAATSLADLCVRMKEISLNWPIKWPIAKIRKHSRPVYLTDVPYTSDPNMSIVRLNDGSTIQTTTVNGSVLVTVRSTTGNASTTVQAPSPTGTVTNTLPDGTTVRTKLVNGIVTTVTTTRANSTSSTQYGNSLQVLSSQGAQNVTVAGQIKQQLDQPIDAGGVYPIDCNVLTDQVYCQIPECFDFCVNEDHVVGLYGSATYSDQFFHIQTSGGFTLNGNLTPNVDTNTNPSGGFVLGGSSDAKCDYFAYTASDRGLMLSSDNEVVSSAWNYVMDSDLIIAGSSIASNSTYTFNASGNLYFTSNSISVLKLRSSMNFAPYLAGTSSTINKYNYVAIPHANLDLGGSAVSASNYYQVIASGGLTISSDNRTVSPSWIYDPNINLTLSGIAPIKHRTTAIGGISIGGSSNISMNLRHSGALGLILSGSSIVESSDSYTWHTTGGVQLSGISIPSWQNLGLFTVGLSASSSLSLFEPVFTTILIDNLSVETGSVNGSCGCNPIPIKLKMQHNLNETSILKDFLTRNNLSFPSIINLIYNKQDSSWRATYHFKGAGSDSREDWHLILEWICGSYGSALDSVASWNLSVLITRIKKTTPIEKYDTRLLYSFEQSAACNDNTINFPFTINTNTEQVITPNTLIVSEALIHDDIGLFLGKQWQKTAKLSIKISTLDTFAPTPQKDIFSLFSE